MDRPKSIFSSKHRVLVMHLTIHWGIESDRDDNASMKNVEARREQKEQITRGYEKFTFSFPSTSKKNVLFTQVT